MALPCASHSLILRALHLLRQAHQEHIRPLIHPFRVQLLLRLTPHSIIRRLQTLQQLGEGVVHLRRQDRHLDCVCGDNSGEGAVEVEGSRPRTLRRSLAQAKAYSGKTLMLRSERRGRALERGNSFLRSQQGKSCLRGKFWPIDPSF